MLTLTNKATVKTTYEIDIHITTTDGVAANARTVVVQGISINIVCGRAST